MADNVAITAGAGTSVATDDVGGVHYQRFKLDAGADGASAPVGGSTDRGLYVDPRAKAVRISQTPTVSTTPAYTAKDAVGGLLTFANAVRASGGSGLLQSIHVVDKGQQMANLDLVLFDATFTAPTDNAIFAPSDAELATCVGVIPIYAGDYNDFSTNSVATKPAVGLEFVLAGTSLFGALVTRGTPTYTSTSDLTVILTVLQD